MNIFLKGATAGMVWAALTGAGRAEHVLPTPQPCAPIVEKTISLPRTYLMEEQSATTLPELKVREVEVGRARELEVAYREERRQVVVMTLRPREVEKHVVVTTLVPVTTPGPCPGKYVTTYERAQTVRTFKATEYDCVPEARVVVVKVPYLRPGGDVVVKKLTVDATTVSAIQTKFRAVTIPSEIVVPAPPCPLAHPLP